MEDATAASVTENNEQKNTHMFVLSVRVNDIEKEMSALTVVILDNKTQGYLTLFETKSCGQFYTHLWFFLKSN